MSKILGLDLGSSSVGWAFIEETDAKSEIRKLGVRVIPYTGDEKDQFTKGQAISINKDRTLKRTARKTIYRYKQRRESLNNFIKENNFLSDEFQIMNISSLELFGLRAKAAKEKIELFELGRILLHLNQKRGYKSSRHSSSEEESGKKISDYLQELKERKEEIEKENITIGEYFYRKLKENEFFRVKQNVFPRECYIDEFHRIWGTQSKFYPAILTEENKRKVRDEIIYYQRRLKSQKGLVGKCQFELYHKVAPKSSPLFQIEKIWESINNITLSNKHKEVFSITLDQKEKLFEHLDNNEKLNQTDLFKILGLKRTDGWYPNEQIKKAGIQGNITKVVLLKKFKSFSIDKTDLLQFSLTIAKKQRVDKDTGEISEFEMVESSFEKEPLYQLWHLLYSVDDPILLEKTLVNRYGFTSEQAFELGKIDFKKSGFGNKSAKAIRKILPGLIKGNDYSKSAEFAGYNHSNSITKEENEKRELKPVLKLYKKNSLRQPVVEKILNQLINIINSILKDEDLGTPDEIRVELARELRQSQEERNRSYSNIIKTDKEHKAIRERLEQEYPGLKISRKVIEKFKLYEQQDGICIYSGEQMELAKVLRGEGIDVDHIIPQSRLFDDSFQNKVLAYRKENESKGDFTAFDYMKAKSEDAFQQYTERVSRLYDSEKITRSKQTKLLMAVAEIPDDFITRQLNETRFISKEATRLLKEICRNVYSTSGAVTDFLRSQWGYNEVLQQLNWDKYEAAGKISNGKIEGWSKRDDHRHHAIDALVVACTKQSFIQRLNRLNSGQTREEMLDIIKGKVNDGWQAKKSLIEQHVQVLQPFTTHQVKEAVSNILISIKPGKKVATIGNNKANGQRPVTPRGQLHKEQVYGKIKRYSEKKTPLNSRFTETDLIVNENERRLVKERITAFDGDVKKAFKGLDKNPIWLDEAKTKQLTEVTLWEEFFVYKYTLDQNFKEKDIDSIIDNGIREKVRRRFIEKAGQKDHPLKNLENEPIWLNDQKRIPIKSVRCFTGLNGLVPLHVAENGITKASRFKTNQSKPVDFVSTRNNHHIAIYKTPQGQLEERSVTLWEAVERKKIGLPIIIKEPDKTWDYVLEKGIDNQEMLKNLPEQDWEYHTSLQQNELFVFRMTREDLQKCIDKNDYKTISAHLYRVQKIATKNYFFRHHLETSVDDKKNGGELFAKQIDKIIIIQSLDAFKERNPIKVTINGIGLLDIAK